MTERTDDKKHESSTPRTQREFYDKVVEELNMDTTDVFTKLLANAFALADQRDLLKRDLAEAKELCALTEQRLIDATLRPSLVATETKSYVPVDGDCIEELAAMCGWTAAGSRTMESYLKEAAEMFCRSGEAPPSPLAAPIDMLLFCPRCGMQHVDAAQPEQGWTNPPHATHTCQGCGLLWRPSNENTNGAASIPVQEDKHRERIAASFAVPHTRRTDPSGGPHIYPCASCTDPQLCGVNKHCAFAPSATALTQPLTKEK